MSWISIIPVRSGSKGVRNKNTRSILGKPLFQYTVDFALRAGAKKIYISTDIEEILNSYPEEKVIVTKRDKNLCNDDTMMSDVLLNFLTGTEGMKIKDNQTIVLLQATSPLRQKQDLFKALKLFENSCNTDLMMAVTRAENHALKYGFVVDGTFKHISDPHLCFENRQNLPKLFKPTGGFYIFKAGWYRKNKSLATNATKAYEIPNNLSLDIDSLDDFAKFELILKGKGL